MPRAQDLFTKMHWGIEPTTTHEVDDPDLPNELTMMGQLLEVSFVPAQGESIEPLTADSLYKENGLTMPFRKGGILAFHPGESRRLFMILIDKDRRACRQELLDSANPWGQLGRINVAAGGRQAQWSCPAVQVQVLGPCFQVQYGTSKKGDGKSIYFHDLGDEGGYVPWLCVDATGRLWFAGGDYDVREDGILN